MTNKHLALQIRNRLQKYGIQTDADALFDAIYESIQENSIDPKPTLRDQFAIAVLAGQESLEDKRTYPGDKTNVKEIEEWREKCNHDVAEYCYKMADAMMKSRGLGK